MTVETKREQKAKARDLFLKTNQKKSGCVCGAVSTKRFMDYVAKHLDVCVKEGIL